MAQNGYIFCLSIWDPELTMGLLVIEFHRAKPWWGSRAPSSQKLRDFSISLNDKFRLRIGILGSDLI